MESMDKTKYLTRVPNFLSKRWKDWCQTNSTSFTTLYFPCVYELLDKLAPIEEKINKKLNTNSKLSTWFHTLNKIWKAPISPIKHENTLFSLSPSFSVLDIKTIVIKKETHPLLSPFSTRKKLSFSFSDFAQSCGTLALDCQSLKLQYYLAYYLVRGSFKIWQQLGLWYSSCMGTYYSWDFVFLVDRMIMFCLVKVRFKSIFYLVIAKFTLLSNFFHSKTKLRKKIDVEWIIYTTIPIIRTMHLV